MRKVAVTSFYLLLLGSLSLAIDAQSKKSKRTPKQPPPTTVATPQPTPEPPVPISTKKNERPNSTAGANGNNTAAYLPVYFYEFTRPGFNYERVLIEHDEAGKGKISFKKSDYAEMISDPIQLTAVTMANLTAAFTALNFLASNENYQTPMDHSNMGNVSITVRKDGRERTAKYNWTDNKYAKALADEYRRISNEYTWKFELSVARENQPLQTPSLMDRLAGYIRQNEISDPPHLLPMLSELSTDERLPLIARDNAAKLVKQIEKAKK